MQYLTRVVIDPSGGVWVANNIDVMIENCIQVFETSIASSTIDRKLSFIPLR